MDLTQLPQMIDRLELIIATLEGGQETQGLLDTLTNMRDALNAEAAGLQTVVSGLSAMTASRIEDMQSRMEGMEKAIVSMESATRGLVVLKDPETWVKGTKTALVAQFEKDPEFAKSFAAMAERAFSDTSKEVLGKELIDLFKSATTDFENRVVNKVFENENEYQRTKRENLKLKDSLETEKERVAFLEKQLSSIGNLSSNSGTNYFNVIGSFIMGLVLAYLFFKGA